MLHGRVGLRTALLFLLAAPAMAQGRADALLVVADDGALEAPAVHALRSVAVGELRKRGVNVLADRRAEGVRPVDDTLAALSDDLGAQRVFALRVGGRLGQKVPLSFEELAPGTLAPVYSASLTAGSLEECDVVTARLVDAVMTRTSAESTAQMRTVTASESKPFAKKPGERFWFIGLPVALYNGGRGTPFGFTLGYGYEAENFRLSASTGGYTRNSDGVAFLALEAAWIPFATEISPYFGGGLGYMGAGGEAGMGGLAEAGLEFFRLHGVRALAGVQLSIPFFETRPGPDHRVVYPAAFVRLAF
ncbi:MAG TPA: hypothetical protein VFL36_04615 [Myxococcales bacterium]|nr:hypothetical protein [Myxococcales bacterium]